MLSNELRNHLALIGSEGGKKSSALRQLSKDDMCSLAKLSWTPEARAKRLSTKRAKRRKPPKLNNNKSIA